MYLGACDNLVDLSARLFYYTSNDIKERKMIMGKTDPKYEALFTPWKVGNVEIKNRIVMCPMGGTSLFGWFELTGCHFDKEAAKLFLE